MLKEKLLTKEFYLDYLSLFLKNSYGIEDRLETYVAELNNMNDVIDKFVSYYDLYLDDYFTKNEIDVDSTVDKTLDMIGRIFNINRNMTITYTGAGIECDPATLYGQYTEDEINELMSKWAKPGEIVISGGAVVSSVPGYPYGEFGNQYTQSITLTNKELYEYILFMIAKLNFDGTNEMIEDLYGSYLNTSESYTDYDIKSLQIRYFWDTTLNCNIYMQDPVSYKNNGYTNNIVKLFLASNFTIESLGIVYNKLIAIAGIEVGKFNADPIVGDSIGNFYDGPDEIIYIFN